MNSGDLLGTWVHLSCCQISGTPVGGLGAVTTDWLGEQPGSREQGRDLQAARRPGWAASVGSVCCLLFVGLIDCCLLCTLGVLSPPSVAEPSLPVAFPEAIIVLPFCSDLTILHMNPLILYISEAG